MDDEVIRVFDEPSNRYVKFKKIKCSKCSKDMGYVEMLGDINSPICEECSEREG